MHVGCHHPQTRSPKQKKNALLNKVASPRPWPLWLTQRFTTKVASLLCLLLPTVDAAGLLSQTHAVLVRTWSDQAIILEVFELPQDMTR